MSIQGIKGIQNQIQPEGLKNPQVPAPQGADSFKNALRSIDQLNKNIANVEKALDIKFSNHAVERMRARGIHFKPDVLSRINEAVDKAAAKGAKETLVLTDNAALIVGVENKTIVTVMGKEGLKDRVFTNVDSTVMI